MKFEQDIFYTFKIAGTIDVPEKGDHYILLHESGRKMLLKCEYYVKYNFEIGQNINCKVDKVNCTGQVFLEPRHPHYIEGQEYLFKKEALKENADKSLSLVVKDLYNNEIELFVNQFYSTLNEDQILLRVDRIKKGFPVLSFPLIEGIVNNNDSLTYSEFRISAIIKENSEEYYSLEDKYGRIASRLKVKYYKHYGLVVGNHCYCRIIGQNSNGLMILEPKNPWYKVGESYYFKINSVEKYIDLEGKEVKSLIVLDKANNKAGVVLTEEELKQIVEQSEVKCRVIGFRKGRPQLEIDL